MVSKVSNYEEGPSGQEIAEQPEEHQMTMEGIELAECYQTLNRGVWGGQQDPE